MNKKNMLLLLVSFGLIFSIGLASAQWFFDFRSASQTWIMWIQDIFGPFFEVFLGPGGYLFERILFLFIVFSVAYLMIGKIPVFQENKGAKWVVTIAVSLLSVRFLVESQYIRTILLPYSVLGIILAAGIPIIILFYFIYSFQDKDVLRKILWISSGAIYLGLWFSRYSELGDLSWIYFIAAVASLIFMLADGTIRRALINQQMKQLGITSRVELERDLKRKIKDLDNDLREGVISQSQYNMLKRKLKSNYNAMMKS